MAGSYGEEIRRRIKLDFQTSSYDTPHHFFTPAGKGNAEQARCRDNYSNDDKHIMAGIKNIEGLSVDEINRELNNGAKFVVFQYCISIVIMTFRRGSNVYFIRQGESTINFSLGFTLITLFLGWWGIPWGPIYSIGSIYNNIRGGKDVTQEVLDQLNSVNQEKAG